MPFKLHPSGYCVPFEYSTNKNLIPGKPCTFCMRVAGHSIDCPNDSNFPLSGGVDTSLNGKSSRGALFNATSVLWHLSKVKSFITFTLPSIDNGYYQQSASCENTGDLVVTAAFSKVLEAYALRLKRLYGDKLYYVWVSEAQMERQEKFGGIGDIHFHLVVNQKYKEDVPYEVINNRARYAFVDDDARDEIMWMQSLWCKHLGIENSLNSVHVDPIPDNVNSIPAYLSKYLGKGTMRKIVSRRFGCSRNLSKYKPITLEHAPGVELINRQVKDFDGYKVTMDYYSTADVMELYNKAFQDESDFVGGSKGRAGDFTEAAIEARREAKSERVYWEGVDKCLQREGVPESVIRPTRLGVPLSEKVKRELKLERELRRIRDLGTKG